MSEVYDLVIVGAGSGGLSAAASAAQAVADQVPWTTFTDPEVTHVGLTEPQARDQFGDAIMTCHWPMARVDRARTDGDTAGFIKLIHRKDWILLGATIVGSRAGEMIHEWIVALQQGIKVGDLSNAIHVYTSYSVAVQQAAAAIRIDRLLSGTSGRMVPGLAHLMRSVDEPGSTGDATCSQRVRLEG